MKTREQRTRVDTYEVKLLCAEGGDHRCGGEMECVIGESRGRETRWKHRCPRCGEESWEDRSYPYTEYAPCR